MKITVIRKLLTDTFTIGDLYLDGKLFCQTLEDKVREPGVKIPGQTAIPAGEYQLRMTYSHRFKKVMPQLMNVPMFEGVRIHSGNTERDTEGCLLVGKQQGDHLVNSRDTYNDLMDVIEYCREIITITIK